MTIISLNNNFVQQVLAQRFTSVFSQSLGTQVEVGHVSLDFFHSLVIHDLKILDTNNDTLLYSSKTTIDLKKINIKSKTAVINLLDFNGLCIKFYKDSVNGLNINKLLENFKKTTDSTSKNWVVKIEELSFLKSRLSYSSQTKKTLAIGLLNYDDLLLSNFNLKIKDYSAIDDSISFDIRKMSFTDKSGFHINQLTSKFTITNKLLLFEKNLIMSDQTIINAPVILFSFQSFDDFSDFSSKVNAKLKFSTSKIKTTTLAYFITQLKEIDETFLLSGTIYGSLNSIKIKGIKILYQENTRFEGDVNLNGLPNIQETFIYSTIKTFKVNATELVNIKIPSLPKGHLDIPTNFHTLGNVNFSGTFSGFINEFVTYGAISTSLGTIHTDLKLKKQPNFVAIDGSVKTSKLDIYQLFAKGNPLGTAGFELTLNGKILDDGSIEGDLGGTVQSVEAKGYRYSNMKFLCNYNNKIFTSSFEINDPNVKIIFDGKADLSESIPTYNFISNIEKLNLRALKIDTLDSAFNISTTISSTFKGNNLNNIEGSIQLTQLKIERNRNILKIDSILILSSDINNISKHQLKSSIFDAQISGNYKLAEIPKYIKYLASNQIKGVFEQDVNQHYDSVSFIFDIKLKQPNLVTNFFDQNILIKTNSSVSGKVNLIDHSMHLDINIPEIRFSKLNIKNFKLISNLQNDQLNTRIHLDESGFSKRMHLNNIDIVSSLTKDTLLLGVDWAYPDSALGLGQLSILGYYTTNIISKRPIYHFESTPTSYYLGENKWHSQGWKLQVDSNAISINNFEMHNGESAMSLNGVVSSDPTQKLTTNFKNFELKFIHLLWKTQQLHFSGNITGDAVFSDIYSKINFLSNVRIDSLCFNSDCFGSVHLLSVWNEKKHRVDFTLKPLHKNKKYVKVDGYYKSADDFLHLNIDYKKADVKLLSPFINPILTNIRGIADGYIKISGPTDFIVLNGVANIDTAAFDVAYVNTPFIIKDSRIAMRNNNIIFDNMQLFDKDGAKCLFYGSINSHYFKDLIFNLRLETQNALVLNTNALDNSYFYGKVYATGSLDIIGDINNIHFNAKAITADNTVFNIPQNYSGELLEKKFVSFKANTLLKKDSIIKPQTKTSTGIAFDMDITVLPNASVSIIFDPRIGDIIETSGNGNFKINVNTLGELKIYGNYEVEKGDYLFTFGNVINKKLNVEKGSTLVWSGDPINANVNLNAIYKTRTSLYTLLVEENEEYKKRIPVHCMLNLKNNLLSPDIKYSIDFPGLSEETKTVVAGRINTQDELNNQFIALLLTNSFFPQRPNTTSGSTSTSSNLKQGLSTTSLEFMSNQFSNWLSQWTKDFEIGVNYRPGEQAQNNEQLYNEQLELALSTQLLNDRVSINGNFDMGLNRNNTSSIKNQNNNFAGDFNIEVKLTENGKWKLRAYNRSNELVIYDQQQYTQGVGVLYRENFNSLSDLKSKVFGKLVNKNSIPTKETP